MLPKNADREAVLHRLEAKGGLRPGVVDEVHRETGVPAADIYGVATFYHLVARPDVDVRVCQGLSCQLFDCAGLKRDVEATGSTVEFASCLGRCDQAPALWRSHGEESPGHCGLTPSADDLAIDLAAGDTERWTALPRVAEQGPEWVLDQLEASGLSGRGGAGFPAHIKWRAVRRQAETERYVVLNADEGEPGTFKDREVMLRRPHLVIEGLTIAATVLEAEDVYIYVRGEFPAPKRALVAALDAARARGDLGTDIRWHVVDGHGAYICGEETALLEALEGKRGMPRMKPPFPVEKGFRDKPTLIQNVETIACLPAILERGGEWFRALGRTEPGTKLYCLSLQAFSPGGASSGFLPADRVDIAMDFASLREVGSMLGSAGVVVLDDTVDMVEAALIQAVFFEDESCGQCSPCRIGTQMIRQALERYRAARDPSALDHLGEVMWGMGEASICGLGQAAFYPLRSAIEHFPAAFGRA